MISHLMHSPSEQNHAIAVNSTNGIEQSLKRNQHFTAHCSAINYCSRKKNEYAQFSLYALIGFQEEYFGKNNHRYNRRMHCDL